MIDFLSLTPQQHQRLQEMTANVMSNARAKEGDARIMHNPHDPGDLQPTKVYFCQHVLETTGGISLPHDYLWSIDQKGTIVNEELGKTPADFAKLLNSLMPVNVHGNIYTL